MKKKITIGGIGSVLLGDDGVGPYVAGVLEAAYRFESGVTVADLGTPGLDLVAHLSGIDAVILIDSVKNDAPPGSVTLYRKEDILRHGPAPVRMDPHAPALSESMLIAELTGEGPEEILLIGITGEQYEVGADLSEPAKRAAHDAVGQVLIELDRLGSSYSEVQREAFSAWWKPLAENSLTPSSQLTSLARS
ncbi:MAG: hydrogenase maturation protease [Terriglobales bacterium]